MFKNDKECYFCGATNNLERHHIYFGSNRKISEREGFTCYLCQKHHRGTYGIHGSHGRHNNLVLKTACQLDYEEKGGTREDFIKLIGRSYL